MPPIVPPSCLSFYHTPRAPLPRFPRQRHRPSSSSSSTFLLLPLLFPFSLSPPPLSLFSLLSRIPGCERAAPTTTGTPYNAMVVLI